MSLNGSRRAEVPNSGRFLPVLLVLFIGSGCSALIYEIVWLQLLQFVIGSSAVSMAVLLGTFMGGMCLGSLALPRIVSLKRHPLRVYGALELAMGAFGIAVLFGLPYIARLYSVAATDGAAGFLLRGLAGAVCLLPPTLLMGATLPVISRRVEVPAGISAHARSCWPGFFYACNIAGGVLGCLLAGFWLLRVFDMAITSYVAAAINLTVGLLAFVLASAAPATRQPAQFPDSGLQLQAAPIYVTTGLSGLGALGAEVVWTRLLSLTFGATVYTFSIILAIFLIGLGIGSALGSLLTRYALNPRRVLAACQFLLVAGIAWSSYMVAGQLPYWGKNLAARADPWRGFLLDFGCSALAILPATILWGASFPLALSSVNQGEPGLTVGKVYASNTVGAIVGAVAFSIFLVPLIGSRNSERILVLVAGIAAATALGRAGFKPLVVVSGAALLFISLISPVPWQLIAFGRRMPLEAGPWKKLYVAEGMNSSIAYSEWIDKRRFFHVAGKIEASTSPADMKLQRVLGRVPALLHPNPGSVLIVGCGAGVTAGTFVVHPRVERMTLCEIEPLIPPASARFLAKENHNVVRDPRTRIVYDDARHYLLTTSEKFDIITSDPIHPWVKGAATLYSKEYFEMCRGRLNPGGLITQWVPLYESDLDSVKSEIATFFSVFREAVIWGNLDAFDQGYDLVLMGSAEPVRIDVDAVQRRIDQAPGVARSLSEVGFRSAAELLGIYAARSSDLRPWLTGAQINRDRGLRLQYLAGMSVNQARAGFIYSEIVRRSQFPEDLFTGSEKQMAAMRKSFNDWRTSPF